MIMGPLLLLIVLFGRGGHHWPAREVERGLIPLLRVEKAGAPFRRIPRRPRLARLAKG